MPMMVPDVAETIGAEMHDDVVTDADPAPTTVRDQLAAGRRCALRLTAAPCRRTSLARRPGGVVRSAAAIVQLDLSQMITG